MNGYNMIIGSVIALFGIIGGVYAVAIKPQTDINMQVQKVNDKQDEKIEKLLQASAENTVNIANLMKIIDKASKK